LRIQNDKKNKIKIGKIKINDILEVRTENKYREWKELKRG
jgi:hypothetical protein